MMNMFNRISESCFARIHHHAVLLAGALLLCTSLGAIADDIEEASKLFKQGHQNEALDKVNGYLAGKPKDAQARFLKGLILTDQGKTAEAIQVFSDLTVDYPELPEPYNNLAVLYAGQGQYDKAKQELELAIRTHPSYATAHENLGDIYAKMASQAYDRALQLDHSNTTTQTKLAMIQELFAGGSHEKVASPRSAPAKPEKATPVITANKPDSAQPLPAPKPDIDDSKMVRETLIAWAAAWSSKDPDKYLSFYAGDFKIPGGVTRAAWEASRKERINAPKFIHVDVRILSTQIVDSTHATVKFHQTYKASHLNASGNKTMLLVKAGGKWLIQEERSR